MSLLTKYYLVIIICSQIACDKMEYKVLDCFAAADLKKHALFLESIEFNQSTVYTLDKSTYLVMPLNPFGKSLLIYNYELLKKFIKEENFPDDENANIFYLENKVYIDNILKYKEKLKVDLLKNISNKEIISIEKNDSKQIDHIYQILKTTKTINKYKLNFLVLLGEYLISNDGEKRLHWGLLSKKQLLNPIINLVLIDNVNKTYFNLEETVFGKWSYLGLQSTRFFLKNNLVESNKIDTIIKVF